MTLQVPQSAVIFYRVKRVAVDLRQLAYVSSAKTEKFNFTAASL